MKMTRNDNGRGPDITFTASHTQVVQLVWDLKDVLMKASNSTDGVVSEGMHRVQQFIQHLEKT